MKTCEKHKFLNDLEENKNTRQYMMPSGHYVFSKAFELNIFKLTLMTQREKVSCQILRTQVAKTLESHTC
jgi:hypothetical protein